MLLNRHFQMLFGLFISFCIGAIRLHSGLDIPNYLWAEDALIFFNQANQLGINSIFHAYAGYLHIYPRIWSYIASGLPITFVPYLYFCGWWVAFTLSMVWIIRLLQSRGTDFYLIIVFISLVLIQPNDGEIFFSLTNSQWFLGLALILTAVMFDGQGRWVWSIPVFLVSLTGPFSIIASGILVCRAVLFRLSVHRNPILWSVLLGAVIQVLMLMVSPRPVNSSLNYNILAWVHSYLAVLLLGAGDAKHLIIAAVLWIFSFSFLIKQIRIKGVSDPKVLLMVVILGALFLNITAVFFGLKDPYAMMAFARNGGGRYTFSPYALMMLFWLLALEKHRKWLFAVAVAILVVFWGDFKQPIRQNMQFDAFATVSRYHDIAIPINPASNNNIHSYLLVENKSTLSKKPDETYSDLEPRNDGGHIVLNELHCERSIIELQMQIERNNAGDVVIEWFSRNDPLEKPSRLAIHYPAGEERTVFAFPVSAQSIDVIVGGSGLTNASQIKKARYMCLNKE